jgi:GTP cyclohydrolase II
MGLEGYGIFIDKQLPIYTVPHLENQVYLETKRKKMGHQIPRSVKKAKKK